MWNSHETSDPAVDTATKLQASSSAQSVSTWVGDSHPPGCHGRPPHTHTGTHIDTCKHKCSTYTNAHMGDTYSAHPKEHIFCLMSHSRTPTPISGRQKRQHGGHTSATWLDPQWIREGSVLGCPVPCVTEQHPARHPEEPALFKVSPVTH